MYCTQLQFAADIPRGIHKTAKYILDIISLVIKGFECPEIDWIKEVPRLRPLSPFCTGFVFFSLLFLSSLHFLRFTTRGALTHEPSFRPATGRPIDCCRQSSRANSRATRTTSTSAWRGT